jgi:hypothetical protein
MKSRMENTMVTLTDIMQVLAMSPLPTLTSYLVPLVMAAKNHATSGQRYLRFHLLGCHSIHTLTRTQQKITKDCCFALLFYSVNNLHSILQHQKGSPSTNSSNHDHHPTAQNKLLHRRGEMSCALWRMEATASAWQLQTRDHRILITFQLGRVAFVHYLLKFLSYQWD